MCDIFKSCTSQIMVHCWLLICLFATHWSYELIINPQLMNVLDNNCQKSSATWRVLCNAFFSFTLYPPLVMPDVLSVYCWLKFRHMFSNCTFYYHMHTFIHIHMQEGSMDVCHHKTLPLLCIDATWHHHGLQWHHWGACILHICVLPLWSPICASSHFNCLISFLFNQH